MLHSLLINKAVPVQADPVPNLKFVADITYLLSVITLPVLFSLQIM